jgi:DNA-binding IclR family transcriptional regulator
MLDRDPRRRAPHSKPASIATVAVATAIIDFLAESERPAGVQQIASILDMTKSRASRHLANLESLGLVARGPGGRGFQLGWRTIRWGQIASSRLTLAQMLDAPLRRLNERTGKTILLCGAAGGDAIVIQCLPAHAAIRIDVQAGLVLGLPHSPSARVCYAFQPRERRRELIEHVRRRETGFRIEDEAAFERMIADVQRTYHSWDADKLGFGYGAVAAPVFDRDLALAAIVTIMLSSNELNGTAPPVQLATELLSCAERCSRMLGAHINYPGTGAA